jgi:5'-3' exonuclease
MTNLALIDADILVWGASYEKENMYDVAEYLEYKLAEILQNTESYHYKFFLGGYNNFRYHIRGDYKANRTGEHPVLFEATKDYVVNSLNAFVSNGVETDDSIVATAKYVVDNKLFNPIVCSTDKDFKIKPLTIYSWERHIKGNVFPHSLTTITEKQALQNFYGMLLTGDSGDNIKICKGIGKTRAAKMLSGLSQYDMTRTVISTYKSFYGSRWRHKLTEVFHLINLIDDYNRVKVPKAFDFAL